MFAYSLVYFCQLLTSQSKAPSCVYMSTQPLLILFTITVNVQHTRENYLPKISPPHLFPHTQTRTVLPDTFNILFNNISFFHLYTILFSMSDRYYFLIS